jgi:DNA modification methylase
VIPYYADDLVTLYHGDCRELLPGIEADVVVTDPPYGIGWLPRVNHQDTPWRDDERFDVLPLLDIGSGHCFWGGNYFPLPPTESWLLWIKRPLGYDFDGDPRSYSTVEMAWTDFGGKPRTHNQTWDGGKRAGDPSNREFLHPAQKPLELMRWCIELAPPGTVLDPFAGSGTTLLAAKSLNRKSIGIEIEERYCEIAANRCRQEVLGLVA